MEQDRIHTPAEVLEESKHTSGPHAHDERHMVPLSTYNTVICCLLVLLLITVGVAMFDFEHLGPKWAWINVTVAVGVAIAKATLILLYFMHLKWHSKVVWLFAGAAYMWLSIMFLMTFADYFTRGWLH